MRVSLTADTIDTGINTIDWSASRKDYTVGNQRLLSQDNAHFDIVLLATPLLHAWRAEPKTLERSRAQDNADSQCGEWLLAERESVALFLHEVRTQPLEPHRSVLQNCLILTQHNSLSFPTLQPRVHEMRFWFIRIRHTNRRAKC